MFYIKIAVEDMDTKHIENTLAMLKRKGFVGAKTLYFYLTCTPPTADGALMGFEQEQNYVLSAPITKFVDIFEDELEHRKNLQKNK